MQISKYMKEAEILLDLRAGDKDSAIAEIAAALKQNPCVRRFDLFLHDIFERESFSTTGIGNGIAIPHARTEAVSDIVIALGRSAAGVEFDSFDGKPVRLVFLLGTPKRKNLSLYLSVLATLTRLLEGKSFRNRLLDAGTPAEVIAAFRAIEH